MDVFVIVFVDMYLISLFIKSIELQFVDDQLTNGHIFHLNQTTNDEDGILGSGGVRCEKAFE